MKSYLLTALFTLAIIQISFAGDPNVVALGVTTTPLSQAAATNSKNKFTNGVVVTEVTPNTIASDLGLKKDDIIHAVNGQDIINADQLSAIIKSMKKGDQLVVTITRNNKSWDLKGSVREHKS